MSFHIVTAYTVRGDASDEPSVTLFEEEIKDIHYVIDEITAAIKNDMVGEHLFKDWVKSKDGVAYHKTINEIDPTFRFIQLLDIYNEMGDVSDEPFRTWCLTCEDVMRKKRKVKAKVVAQRMILFPVTGLPEVITFDNGYETISEHVSEHFEMHPGVDEGDIALYYDEDGEVKELSFNEFLNGKGVVVRGPAILSRADDDGLEMGLTDEDIATWVPAAMLVGIELNPGPMIYTVIDPLDISESTSFGLKIAAQQFAIGSVKQKLANIVGCIKIDRIVFQDIINGLDANNTLDDRLISLAKTIGGIISYNGGVIMCPVIVECEVVIPPAAPLVGIELNPGPMVVNVTKLIVNEYFRMYPQHHATLMKEAKSGEKYMCTDEGVSPFGKDIQCSWLPLLYDLDKFIVLVDYEDDGRPTHTWMVMDVPAKPLVGIESNPGPVMTHFYLTLQQTQLIKIIAPAECTIGQALRAYAAFLSLHANSRFHLFSSSDAHLYLGMECRFIEGDEIYLQHVGYEGDQRMVQMLPPAALLTSACYVCRKNDGGRQCTLCSMSWCVGDCHVCPPAPRLVGIEPNPGPTIRCDAENCDGIAYGDNIETEWVVFVINMVMTI